MFEPLLAFIFRSTLSGVAVAAGQFSQLDEDWNGTISRADATNLPDLYNDWERTDINADGVLDQVAFSRFEAIPSATGESTEEETE